MEQILRLLPPPPRSALVRYGLSTALVGVCFLALLGLQGQGGLLAFYLLFPAIFASSVLFGRKAGAYATALSALLLYLLMRPADSVLLPRELSLAIGIFVLVALGLAIVSAGLRTAWQRAAHAEQTKDLLLRELGHRTQNNLAMVISVLSLQARSKTDPQMREVLEKAVARVRAIASAHEHVHPEAANGHVEMRSYLEKLCAHLGDALRDVRPIAVRVEADDIYLPTEQAIPLGLIVNELVTNALKHAFPDGRAGAVTVSFRRASSLDLIVEDNGIGYASEKLERLGSRLTKLLAEQLGAKVAWEDATPGCRVRIELSHDKAVQ
jgi:two-component sensor histidine kinase